jgi:hypothetical protein
MDLWVGPTMAVVYLFFNNSWASFWGGVAAIVFRDKSLRSPSAFGHGDWGVDIWMMMSNFSAQKSFIGLCCLSAWFFQWPISFLSFPLISPFDSVSFWWGYQLFIPGMVLGKVFPGEVGLLRGSTYHKGYFGSINWFTHHKKYSIFYYTRGEGYYG